MSKGADSKATLSHGNAFLKRHLSDRQVQGWKCYTSEKAEVTPEESIFPLLARDLVANGVIDHKDQSIRVAFQGGQGTYQARLKLAESVWSNGIGARFRLDCWETLRYVAVGYSHEKAFRHVKIVNAALGQWINFSIGHQDLAFGLQNDWQCPPSTEVGDVRIYVNGTPRDGNACLDIHSCWCWLESEAPPSWAVCMPQDATVPSALGDIIYRYLEKCFRTGDDQAKAFMKDGTCPLYGDIALAWPNTALVPTDLNTVGTYRFSWHSLHPAMILMLHARHTGELGPLFAAREMVTNWLERSYFQPDKDKKFAWYDHGTAERLLAMVLMWSIGLEHRFDNRFMTRLRTAMFRHGQLLASELFYASHQPTRYHNHAWFQDLTLMVTALAMKDFPCAEHWMEISTSRFTDQLEHLIVRDNGYAVFVENSIGYHQGVQRLVEFAAELVTFAEKDCLIPTIGKELPLFSEFFRYPDNRAPAQGDTFRRSNASTSEIRRLKPYPEPACTVLPKAGYAIIKGNHDGCRFMIAVLATSLCRTHKHEDNLSFTLFFDGLEWLIDPSFYSHEYAAPLPAYLRSAVAHNNLALPGRSYSIEPGVAQINGSNENSEFLIKGQHSAYEKVLIQREIHGSINRLEFDVLDRAVTQVPNASGGDLRLMLHCGEGIRAELQGKLLQLTHPDSKYLMEIILPNDKSRLYHGELGNPKIRGVTGLGFMQQTSIFSLECPVPFDTELSWTVRIKSAEGL